MEQFGIIALSGEFEFILYLVFMSFGVYTGRNYSAGPEGGLVKEKDKNMETIYCRLQALENHNVAQQSDVKTKEITNSQSFEELASMKRRNDHYIVDIPASVSISSYNPHFDDNFQISARPEASQYRHHHLNPFLTPNGSQNFS